MSEREKEGKEGGGKVELDFWEARQSRPAERKTYEIILSYRFQRVEVYCASKDGENETSTDVWPEVTTSSSSHRQGHGLHSIRTEAQGQHQRNPRQREKEEDG